MAQGFGFIIALRKQLHSRATQLFSNVTRSKKINQTQALLSSCSLATPLKQNSQTMSASIIPPLLDVYSPNTFINI